MNVQCMRVLCFIGAFMVSAVSCAQELPPDEKLSYPATANTQELGKYVYKVDRATIMPRMLFFKDVKEHIFMHDSMKGSPFIIYSRHHLSGQRVIEGVRNDQAEPLGSKLGNINTLTRAIFHGKDNLVEVLLQHDGATIPINTPDDAGYTPLKMATRRNIPIIPLLLYRGARVNNPRCKYHNAYDIMLPVVSNLIERPSNTADIVRKLLVDVELEKQERDLLVQKVGEQKATYEKQLPGGLGDSELQKTHAMAVEILKILVGDECTYIGQSFSPFSPWARSSVFFGLSNILGGQ